MLKEEFQYYLDNQQKFVEQYNGKVIVLKDKKVIGVYTSENEALFQTQKKYKVGTFLIQKCSEGDAAYTQIFHSRVAFA